MSSGYAPPGEERPLGSYAVLMSVFGIAFGGGLLAARRRGHELPQHIAASDVILTGIATQKLSRLLTKTKVTSALRAPFTRYEGPAGQAEVHEQPRGTGLRRSVGELLLCPYCVSQWIAGGFALGLVAAPRTTRLLASMWTAQTIADFTQLAYVVAEEQT